MGETRVDELTQTRHAETKLDPWPSPISSLSYRAGAALGPPSSRSWNRQILRCRFKGQLLLGWPLELGLQHMVVLQDERTAGRNNAGDFDDSPWVGI